MSRLASGSFEPVDLLTLGETMVLFWPANGEALDRAASYRCSCAGAESNLCIALARLGHTARWMSRLGDDPFADLIRRTLTNEAVDVRAFVDPTRPTAVFFKERRPHGPRRVYYYRKGSAASALDVGDIDESLIGAARMVHLTGITPALSSSAAAAVQSVTDLARAAGIPISFDPNVRLQLWASEENCRQTLLPLIENTDIVLLGDEDAAVLFPGVPEGEILDEVLALGPTTVVLKLGARGAIGVRDGERVLVEAHPVEAVDTVGAGDGFDAGFLAGTLRGWGLRRCLELGARIGAAAVASEGDWEGYPRGEEMGLS